MTVMVALLRGVNVGGASTLPMADLRSIASSVGLEDVRTYIQSGNLLFATEDRSTASVASKLQAGIRAATDLDPEVLVRTRAQVERVIERSPFLRRDEDPAQLHVTFMAKAPEAALRGLDLTAHVPEEVAVVGTDLHFLLPGGVGRSKLVAEVGRRIGRIGTMRNWRTVSKLAELAAELG